MTWRELSVRLYVWELHNNAGVAAVALTRDNTNLLVSGTDGTSTVIADPRLGMRFVVGWYRLNPG